MQISRIDSARKKKSHAMQKILHQRGEKVSGSLKIARRRSDATLPERQPPAVNGSMRIALRTKVAITNRPIRKNAICSA